MLTRTDKKTAAELKPLLDRYPELSVRIGALLKAYGPERHFFNIWIQNEYGAVLTRLENTFSILDLGRLDPEEAAFFLEFNPYFKCLTGKLETVAKVASHFGTGYAIERFNLMRLRTLPVSSLRMPLVSVTMQPELRAVFDLIQGALPVESEYMAWYADLSHRIRHGCARACMLSLDGESVSACLVSAESDKAGLISGVVTKEEYRRCGFATHILSFACKGLLSGGKVPVLECVDSMAPYYENLGFEKIDDVGELVPKMKYSKSR